MKALCTAEASDDIYQLDSLLEMNYAGWSTDQRILTEDELVEMMKTVQPDILLTSYDPVTSRVMDASPKLSLIVCTRANPVNVDLEYAASRDIRVSYAPGRNSDCTAEYTVAMMLSVMRKIPFAFRDLKAGKHCSDQDESHVTLSGLKRDITWGLGKDTPYLEYKGHQLKGRTLGVVGYGSIGHKVADLCRAFGMRISVFDPYINPSKYEDDTQYCSTLKELASIADVLTIHAKDTEETKHIINAEIFDVMKQSAFLINTSRGILIDEEALVEALRQKKIAGAALDVFHSEPIVKTHPFLTEFTDNVVITPHLAGATYDAIQNHTAQLLADVKHFIAGENLEFAIR